MDATSDGLTCREVAALLFPFLDHELAPETTLAMRAHLRRCDACAAAVRFEARWLASLGRRLRTTAAPAHLRAWLRDLWRSRPSA